ncbi:hypothetical protein [Amycolatopsis nigrescens]|uniref:hypothetical protein n=1 Tax=Amycolatopsis nigrescens TaxID=381445 RepID=UPI00036C4CD0|nr:hypothetical protein [Amycolatopsis nigrescens]
MKGERMVLALAMCGGLTVLPGSAQAAEFTPTAAGWVGEAELTVGGRQVHAAPIAPCETGGTLSNESRGTKVGSSTEYGRGTSTCARNSDGTATALVTGQRFETRVLEQFGGPAIKVRTYSARCDTTQSGSRGSVELGNAEGITVPSSIPANYTQTIPGRAAGDPPMATVVINELITPSPPDGSLSTNAMRIKLFPEGGPAEGEIVLGAATCDPYGD